MEIDWVEVKNPKNEKRIKKELEKEFWINLVHEYPHIITPLHAAKIQKIINVDGLIEAFTSNIWIQKQKDGWIYVKTIKTGRECNVNEEIEYLELDIGNKWKDKALFKRNI